MKPDYTIMHAVRAVAGVIIDALRSGYCVDVKLVYSRGDVRLSARRVGCDGRLRITYSTIVPAPGRSVIVTLPGSICVLPEDAVGSLSRLLSSVVKADTIADVIGDAVAFAEDMVCCGEERCTVKIDGALRAGGDFITEYLEISAWRVRG